MADRERAGLLREWKTLRYGIYDQKQDTCELRGLAQEFLLTGDIAYYPKLKALIPADEWADVLSRLLGALEEGS